MADSVCFFSYLIAKFSQNVLFSPTGLYQIGAEGTVDRVRGVFQTILDHSTFDIRECRDDTISTHKNIRTAQGAYLLLKRNSLSEQTVKLSLGRKPYSEEDHREERVTSRISVLKNIDTRMTGGVRPLD